MAKSKTTRFGSTTILQWQDQRDPMNIVTSAATFYAGKLLEYKIRKAMIQNVRGGRSYPHVKNTHSSVKGVYTASAPGDYMAVKTGALASLDGQERGYRLRTLTGNKVQNPKQLRDNSAQGKGFTAGVGTTLWYEGVLRTGHMSGSPYIPARKTVADMYKEAETRYQMEEIAKGFIAKLDQRDGKDRVGTPQFPKDLAQRYSWLKRYAKNDIRV